VTYLYNAYIAVPIIMMDVMFLVKCSLIEMIVLACFWQATGPYCNLHQGVGKVHRCVSARVKCICEMWPADAVPWLSSVPLSPLASADLPCPLLIGAALIFILQHLHDIFRALAIALRVLLPVRLTSFSTNIIEC
jgi:hypothetical protein